MERAMILEDAAELLPAHLPPEIAWPRSAAVAGPGFPLPPGGVHLEAVEREFVRQALEFTQGNQTRSARMLGLTRDELRYRMKKFGLVHKVEDDPG
jgi:DNA-binding NtrC family response regulator